MVCVSFYYLTGNRSKTVRKFLLSCVIKTIERYCIIQPFKKKIIQLIFNLTMKKFF